MNSYMMVVRHEPDTLRESECGWWYSHHQFLEETDEAAIEAGHRIKSEVGQECSEQKMRSAGYGCSHSLDELYRVEEGALVSIYDDGVCQSISWGKDGKQIRVKRATDDALRALLLNPFPE
jgi:hypothetical protein